MNTCIICGNDSGFEMICKECKEAIIFAKELKSSAEQEAKNAPIIMNCSNCGRPIRAGQTLCECGMTFVYA